MDRYHQLLKIEKAWQASKDRQGWTRKTGRLQWFNERLGEDNAYSNVDALKKAVQWAKRRTQQNPVVSVAGESWVPVSMQDNFMKFRGAPLGGFQPGRLSGFTPWEASTLFRVVSPPRGLS